MNDLISIVTTLYNYRQYIGDLIQSCLKQNHTDWELIIVDDASADDPMSVIATYKDDRIRYIRLHTNMGYSVAKNEGIIASRGNYIAMIDADDLLTDDSLKVRYKKLISSTDSFWCHGNVYDLRGTRVSTDGFIKRQKLRDELSKEMDLTKNYHHRLIHAQSVMVRRCLHEKLGLYDERLKFSSDNEIFRRFIKFGYVPAYVNDFVAYYRRHDRQMSSSDEKRKLKYDVKQWLISEVDRKYIEGISETNTRLLPKN